MREHLAALIAVGTLAAVHICAGWIWPYTGQHRPRWLSLAGGVTVAYVFGHILPDLAEHQVSYLAHHPDRPLQWFEEQVYVGALMGLLIAYGFDQVSKESIKLRFWTRISSFGLYNALIGYYVANVRRVPGLILAVIALGSHFLVDDHGLQREDRERYRRKGRLILAASVVVGGTLGLTLEVSEPVLGVVYAILAGGIILHALNEEIPEREARFGYFAVGAIGYTALVLAVEAALKH